MFGAVLKNSILFILIILILHFLINNILVEKKIVKVDLDVKDEVKLFNYDSPVTKINGMMHVNFRSCLSKYLKAISYAVISPYSKEISAITTFFAQILDD